MDVPKTTDDELQAREAAADVGAAPSADRCPVDHAADGSAASSPRDVIPATALPGPRLPAPLQVYQIWNHPAAFMERCYERYGSRFVLNIRFPPRPLYVIADHEDLKQMFLAPIDAIHTGLGSSTLEKFTGQTGLAWLDEDEHTVRRRQLLPSVRGQAFQRIQAGITELAAREVAAWPQGVAVTMHPLIHRLTLGVIGEVIFGSALPSCWAELADVLMGMFRINEKITSMVMIHTMSPTAVRVLEAIRPLGLHDFLKLRRRADALIAEAVEERRRSDELGDDMLGVLLGITSDDGSPLSGVELRDEMMTIFLAGTETTASGISWALEHLTREPAILERLVAEIDAGEGDAYLTATVYEVLRLRPPLGQVIGRDIVKPIVIGNVRYEPGDVLLPSPFLAHRDPSVYPEPNEFRPERFLGIRPGIYTWIPFGGGPTRCLGDQIGTFEMKVVLREVLSRYELRRADPRPQGPRSRLVLTVPANGARMELRPRSRNASPAAV